MTPPSRVRLFEMHRGIDRSRIERPRRDDPAGGGVGESSHAVSAGSPGGQHSIARRLERRRPLRCRFTDRRSCRHRRPPVSAPSTEPTTIVRASDRHRNVDYCFPRSPRRSHDRAAHAGSARRRVASRSGSGPWHARRAQSRREIRRTRRSRARGRYPVGDLGRDPLRRGAGREPQTCAALRRGAILLSARAYARRERAA